METGGEQQSSSLSRDFQWDSILGFGWATQGLPYYFNFPMLETTMLLETFDTLKMVL
jgi:hypothetical protein